MLATAGAAKGKPDLDGKIRFDVDIEVACLDVARGKRHRDVQGNKRPRIHPIIDGSEYDYTKAESEYPHTSRAG